MHIPYFSGRNATVLSVLLAGIAMATVASAVPAATSSSLVGSEVAAARGQAPAAGTDASITVTAGGVRTGPTSVAGLADVTFEFFAGTAGVRPNLSSAPAATCTTTAPSGTCMAADLANNQGYWVVQTGVPGGWFENPTLDVGSSTASVAAVYSELFVPGHTGNVTVPPSSTSTGNATRGNLWASSLDNPAPPTTCGLRFALLFDLSTSVSTPVNNLPALKAAGTDFVDALTGTPSSVAVYTFGTTAPASAANGTLEPTSVSTADGAAIVNARINSLTVPAGSATNWDAGVWQIAAEDSFDKYNVVIVLTDGNPNRYGPTGSGTNVNTRFIDVENGIFSANALKNDGTRVAAVGIGNVSTDNLAAISGPVAGSDFFSTDFADLGDVLSGLARENCMGTISIVKNVVPAGGTTAEALPEGGWTFSTSSTTVTPPSDTTAPDTGAVNFVTSATAPEDITFTEDLAAHTDYMFLADDVTCVNTAVSPPADVLVSAAVATASFTVTAGPDDIVSCSVFNEAPTSVELAEVTVNKTWDINGDVFPNGEQPPGFEASLTLDGEEASWGVPHTGTTSGDFMVGGTVDIGDTTEELPPGCTNSTSGDLGPQDLTTVDNTFTVTNTVTCTSTLTLVKQINNLFPGLPAPPLDSWTLTASTAPGAAPVLSGTTGVSGDVPPNVPLILAESSVPGWQQTTYPGFVLADGASGSWLCEATPPAAPRGIEDFGGQDGTVIVGFGDNVTCTAVNQPVTAALTLVKQVVNAPGGTAVPTDWTLTATPGQTTSPPLPTLSGVTGSNQVTGILIPPGIPYTLGESGPAGYRLMGLTCTAAGTQVLLENSVVTAAIGQNVTCTFTNTKAVPVTG
jgi:hypothetical protein